MQHQTDLQRDVKNYIAELDFQGPVVSRSGLIRTRLAEQYGAKVINREIDRQFAAARASKL